MRADSNKLNNIGNRNPFTVPEGYFEEVNERIMKQLPEIESVRQKISLWAKARPWLYIAAALVALLFSFKILKYSGKHDFMVSNKQDERILEQSRQAAGTDQDQSVDVTSFGESVVTSDNDHYWSSVQISESDFYDYIEEQLIEDGLYNCIYTEVGSE